ncbi:hypothetical protein SapgrDRAFT_1840 [Saprospira grandis DSM 2844]|uniref:Uncharacterized protein n=1 Tax=Saprospira grandis DSM 2844 TaxID=694433 RepID=J1I458_9BACT|nr:hypothetical protein SapgrDRAFT_1840 [Saprospira grandis DSM 2844]
MFWGCPALWAGRAVSGLAIRSALRFFALLKSWVCGFAAPLSIPQPAALWACGTRKGRTSLKIKFLEQSKAAQAKKWSSWPGEARLAEGQMAQRCAAVAEGQTQRAQPAQGRADLRAA